MSFASAVAAVSASGERDEKPSSDATAEEKELSEVVRLCGSLASPLAARLPSLPPARREAYSVPPSSQHGGGGAGARGGLSDEQLRDATAAAEREKQLPRALPLSVRAPDEGEVRAYARECARELARVERLPPVRLEIESFAAAPRPEEGTAQQPRGAGGADVLAFYRARRSELELVRWRLQSRWDRFCTSAAVAGRVGPAYTAAVRALGAETALVRARLEALEPCGGDAAEASDYAAMVGRRTSEAEATRDLRRFRTRLRWMFVSHAAAVQERRRELLRGLQEGPAGAPGAALAAAAAPGAGEGEGPRRRQRKVLGARAARQRRRQYHSPPSLVFTAAGLHAEIRASAAALDRAEWMHREMAPSGDGGGQEWGGADLPLDRLLAGVSPHPPGAVERCASGAPGGHAEGQSLYQTALSHTFRAERGAVADLSERPDADDLTVVFARVLEWFPDAFDFQQSQLAAEDGPPPAGGGGLDADASHDAAEETARAAAPDTARGSGFRTGSGRGGGCGEGKAPLESFQFRPDPRIPEKPARRARQTNWPRPFVVRCPLLDSTGPVSGLETAAARAERLYLDSLPATVVPEPLRDMHDAVRCNSLDAAADVVADLARRHAWLHLQQSAASPLAPAAAVAARRPAAPPATAAAAAAAAKPASTPRSGGGRRRRGRRGGYAVLQQSLAMAGAAGGATAAVRRGSMLSIKPHGRGAGTPPGGLPAHELEALYTMRLMRMRYHRQLIRDLLNFGCSVRRRVAIELLRGAGQAAGAVDDRRHVTPAGFVVVRSAAGHAVLYEQAGEEAEALEASLLRVAGAALENFARETRAEEHRGGAKGAAAAGSSPPLVGSEVVSRESAVVDHCAVLGDLYELEARFLAAKRQLSDALVEALEHCTCVERQADVARRLADLWRRRPVFGVASDRTCYVRQAYEAETRALEAEAAFLAAIMRSQAAAEAAAARHDEPWLAAGRDCGVRVQLVPAERPLLGREGVLSLVPSVADALGALDEIDDTALHADRWVDRAALEAGGNALDEPPEVVPPGVLRLATREAVLFVAAGMWKSHAEAACEPAYRPTGEDGAADVAAPHRRGSARGGQHRAAVEDLWRCPELASGSLMHDAVAAAHAAAWRGDPAAASSSSSAAAAAAAAKQDTGPGGAAGVSLNTTIDTTQSDMAAAAMAARRAAAAVGVALDTGLDAVSRNAAETGELARRLLDGLYESSLLAHLYYDQAGLAGAGGVRTLLISGQQAAATEVVMAGGGGGGAAAADRTPVGRASWRDELYTLAAVDVARELGGNAAASGALRVPDLLQNRGGALGVLRQLVAVQEAHCALLGAAVAHHYALMTLPAALAGGPSAGTARAGEPPAPAPASPPGPTPFYDLLVEQEMVERERNEARGPLGCLTAATFVDLAAVKVQARKGVRTRHARARLGPSGFANERERDFAVADYCWAARRLMSRELFVLESLALLDRARELRDRCRGSFPLHARPEPSDCGPDEGVPRSLDHLAFAADEVEAAARAGALSPDPALLFEADLGGCASSAAARASRMAARLSRALPHPRALLGLVLGGASRQGLDADAMAGHALCAARLLDLASLQWAAARCEVPAARLADEQTRAHVWGEAQRRYRAACGRLCVAQAEEGWDARELAAAAGRERGTAWAWTQLFLRVRAETSMARGNRKGLRAAAETVSLLVMGAVADSAPERGGRVVARAAAGFSPPLAARGLMPAQYVGELTFELSAATPLLQAAFAVDARNLTAVLGATLQHIQTFEAPDRDGGRHAHDLARVHMAWTLERFAAQLDGALRVARMFEAFAWLHNAEAEPLPGGGGCAGDPAHDRQIARALGGPTPARGAEDHEPCACGPAYCPLWVTPAPSAVAAADGGGAAAPAAASSRDHAHAAFCARGPEGRGRRGTVAAPLLRAMGRKRYHEAVHTLDTVVLRRANQLRLMREKAKYRRRSSSGSKTKRASAASSMWSAIGGGTHVRVTPMSVSLAQVTYQGRVAQRGSGGGGHQQKQQAQPAKDDDRPAAPASPRVGLPAALRVVAQLSARRKDVLPVVTFALLQPAEDQDALASVLEDALYGARLRQCCEWLSRRAAEAQADAADAPSAEDEALLRALRSFLVEVSHRRRTVDDFGGESGGSGGGGGGKFVVIGRRALEEAVTDAARDLRRWALKESVAPSIEAVRATGGRLDRVARLARRQALELRRRVHAHARGSPPGDTPPLARRHGADSEENERAERRRDEAAVAAATLLLSEYESSLKGVAELRRLAEEQRHRSMEEVWSRHEDLRQALSLQLVRIRGELAEVHRVIRQRLSDRLFDERRDVMKSVVATTKVPTALKRRALAEIRAESDAREEMAAATELEMRLDRAATLLGMREIVSKALDHRRAQRQERREAEEDALARQVREHEARYEELNADLRELQGDLVTAQEKVEVLDGEANMAARHNQRLRSARRARSERIRALRARQVFLEAEADDKARAEQQRRSIRAATSASASAAATAAAPRVAAGRSPLVEARLISARLGQERRAARALRRTLAAAGEPGGGDEDAEGEARRLERMRDALVRRGEAAAAALKVAGHAGCGGLIERVATAARRAAGERRAGPPPGARSPAPGPPTQPRQPSRPATRIQTTHRRRAVPSMGVVGRGEG